MPNDADGKPIALASRSVMIVGAGGVARAIAYALQTEKVPFVLTNRTAERGLLLAEEFGAKYVEWSARHSISCDVIINCTSVGMHPNVDETPIHHSFLTPELMVFDTVYTPETTRLIREARERGCHVLTGVDMFVRQAALQFEQFTGQPAPLELMTKKARKALSPLNVREDTPVAPMSEVETLSEPDEAELPMLEVQSIVATEEATEPMQPRRLLFLTGYRGAGKTSVAQYVAAQLGWPWIDADLYLEESVGRTIKDIFATDGEETFRAHEAALLESFCELDEHVIATGGGIILSEDNRTRLAQGTVVWLWAPAEVLWQRMQADPTTTEQRPDLAQGGFAEVEAMLAERAPLYEACQHLTIDASQQSPEEIAAAIAEWYQSNVLAQ